MKERPYLTHEVYTHDRDLFLRAMFVPVAEREALLAVYALVVELEKIPAIVSEEMIGHIRYAWWQEAVEALYAGKEPHGQPVLEALFPIITSGKLPAEILMPLIEQYRSCYPEAPTEIRATIKNISLSLIGSNQGWLRADRIINKHRAAHGKRLYPWLIIKLLTGSLT